jgi:hypothetical protein
MSTRCGLWSEPVMRHPALLSALFLSAPLLAAPVQAQGPSFIEETATAGLSTVFQGDWEYMVGGGAASFDCNGDGLADLFVSGGSAPAGMYLNRSEQGGPLRFAPQDSGLEVEGVTGAYPLDVDADGVQDLILLRVGENLAMRGTGDCRFERANEAWGFDGGDAWSTALAATWEAGADWPTIAIGNYVDRREEAFPWGSCTDNWLHRPAGNGPGFAPPLPLTPSYCALSMLFTDWNRSGRPSLRVSNDREYYKGGQEQLWQLEPGQPPRLYTAEDGWKFLRIWGMGIASADLTGDGYPEYFLTSMADNKLQTLAPPPGEGPVKPSYADVAWPKGVTAHRPHTGGEYRPSTAWHAQFEDVDNDGRVDLFVAKGNVDKMPDFALADPNNLLMQQSDGTFAEAAATAGVASTAISRGAVMEDFNLDGRVDLVVVNRREPVQVWRNATPGAGNWLQLSLHQPGGNRDAIGAWLEVRCGETVARREITVGGGHVSGQIGWRHMGIGAHDSAEVRVIWPDGTPGDWQPVAANGFYRIARGAPPEAWAPR